MKPIAAPPPLTPDALRIEEALQRSAPLALLRERMRESNRRFEAVARHLPASLVAHVKAGPLDDAGWSLLVANASVASKLRQLQPRLEGALRIAGWASCVIRIKVMA